MVVVDRPRRFECPIRFVESERAQATAVAHAGLGEEPRLGVEVVIGALTEGRSFNETMACKRGLVGGRMAEHVSNIELLPTWNPGLSREFREVG